MMSPTNFLATNPDALERAMETQGQSLIDGMQNLIADLEANEGELVVRLADESAFEVAEHCNRKGQRGFSQRNVGVNPIRPNDRNGA